MKVKSILVSQPKPETDKSPYFELAKKFNLKIDFRSFIQVQGISAKDFRKKRIDITEHGAVILNSKNAADHFFRIIFVFQNLLLFTCKSMWFTEREKYFMANKPSPTYLI